MEASREITELRVNPDLSLFSYGGLPTAWILDNWSHPELCGFHKGLWWFHLVISLCFIACIPFTKLRHLFLTGVNYLFTDLRPKGAIENINLEDESLQSYGAGELTWRIYTPPMPEPLAGAARTAVLPGKPPRSESAAASAKPGLPWMLKPPRRCW